MGRMSNEAIEALIPQLDAVDESPGAAALGSSLPHNSPRAGTSVRGGTGASIGTSRGFEVDAIGRVMP